MFCDKDKMVAACESIGGRRSITRSLKAFRANYEHDSHVYNAALMRVPGEWRDKFHAEALKEKRGRARKRGVRASAGYCRNLESSFGGSQESLP